MRLLDLLACPVCRAPLRGAADALCCEGCARVYPKLNGVPVLFSEPERAQIVHQGELVDCENYFAGAMSMLEFLSSDQVVLDIGAGKRRSDDPRIVRMDVIWTPTVDVIGDAHALPFRDDCVTCVFSAAVFEHLHHPFEAAREMYRVLKPGGQIFADCNFVFPFHGYPAVFFNASVEGLRQLFADFRELEASVAPWQGPTQALSALVGEYLHFFRPRNDVEREFADALRGLARFPVHEFDTAFTRADAARIAAGVYFLGLKQPSGNESTAPPPALAAWENSPELRRRFPNPGTVMPTLTEGPPDTLWRWAMTEGRRTHPELARWFDSVEPFRKDL